MAVLLLLLLTGGLSATRAAVIFEDDFNNPALSATYWTTTGVTPDYSGGTVSFNGGFGSMYTELATDTGTETITYSGDLVLPDSGFDSASITFRGTLVPPDGDIYYRVLISYASDGFLLERAIGSMTTDLILDIGGGVPESGHYEITLTNTATSVDIAFSFGGYTQSFSDTDPSRITSGNVYSIGGTNVTYDNAAVTTVPEPSAAALLGVGALALALRRRR